MNENASRAMDLYVGVPLCWLLTLWRRIRTLVGLERAATGEPRKVLFIKLSEMGAIILAMPALEVARERFGKQNLYALMLAGNREIHDLLEAIPRENQMTIRDGSLWHFVVDVARAMRRCRREGIDTVIDWEGLARISAILSFLTGASRRVGLHRYTNEGLYRGDLYTHRVAVNYYAHASEQFLMLLAALDASPEETPLLKQRVKLDGYRLPRFRPTAEDRAAVDALLQRSAQRTLEGPLVILNCNLIDLLPLRRWPAASFRELGQRLLAEYPEITILLTGLSTEREGSRRLAAEISPERAVSLAGETATLRQLLTLFDRADLLVTSDCGPAHMAALTDIPIVSIFGPETPQLYAPLSPHNHSLWAGLACSPCINAFNHRRSACRENVCMPQITVERVLETIRRACSTLTGNARSDVA
ncbi:MAG: glycosyltransferase family 9 protein [Pirellulales bacterium]|nr:glycosyltransferase family 9 protein [Pirellulales bacterium]